MLCALPALLAMGLLEGTEKYFNLPPGYYAPDSLLLLLAFMALNQTGYLKRLRDLKLFKRAANSYRYYLKGL